MPGGLLQLVAYGSQNLYLNGNPSISFFKKVYKTHTNFATESIRLNFNKNELNFKDSTHLIAKIDRNGDLISNMYFVFTLPEIKKRYHHDEAPSYNCVHDKDPKVGHKFNFVENIGEIIIKEYYIYIGGNIVDKQYGEWFEIWSELTQNLEQANNGRSEVEQEAQKARDEQASFEARIRGLLGKMEEVE